MRRKIALLLVFAMLLSLVPALSVSAQPARGPTDAPVERQWNAVPPRGVLEVTSAATLRNGADIPNPAPTGPAYLDYSRNLQIRGQFIASEPAGPMTFDTTWEGADWALSVVRVQWYRGDRHAQPGTAPGWVASLHPLAGLPSAGDGANATTTPLTWGVSGGGGNIRAVIYADTGANFGWLVVAVRAGQPWFAETLNLPIPFRVDRNNNYDVRFRSYGTRTGFINTFDFSLMRFMAVEGDRNFNIETYGDVGDAFTGERLDVRGRIRVIEDIVGSFTVGDTWRVDLRLIEPGFSWGAGSGARQYSMHGVFRANNGPLTGVPVEVDGVNIPTANIVRVSTEQPERENHILRLQAVAGPRTDLHQGVGRIEFGYPAAQRLIIEAEEDARSGDVRVEVLVRRLTQENRPPGLSEAAWMDREAAWVTHASSTITVARFQPDAGVIVELHDEADLEDYVITSGAGDFLFVNAVDADVPAATRDTIQWADRDTHGTATVSLREAAAGTFADGGSAASRAVNFEFPEGVEVLGINVWRNRAMNDPAGDQTIWFTGATAATGVIPTVIRRNSVTLTLPAARQTGAYAAMPMELRTRFFLSVMPGFEAAFGDEVEVTISGRGIGDQVFTQTVALVQDPIELVVEPTFVGGDASIFQTISLNDIVINEIEPGALENGAEIWVGFDNLGWAGATLSLMGAVQPFGGITASTRQVDGGILITITRRSGEDGGGLRIVGATAVGMVIPGFDHNIIVTGDGIADNFADLDERVRHGEWDTVGFAAPAIRFTPGVPGVVVPDVTPTPVPTVPPVPEDGRQLRAGALPVGVPRTITADLTHITAEGNVIAAPLTRLIPAAQLPPGAEHAATYVVASFVADLIGLSWHWNPDTRTATFSDGVTTVAFTDGNRFANVNGVGREIRAGGGVTPADARIIAGRFHVPVAFLGEVFTYIDVAWNPATQQVTVTRLY